MEKKCCAIIGQYPMRFAWGFDEEDSGSQRLKLVLAQKIMELRQQDVTCFTVVADCGVGLYAGEIINALREQDEDLQLFCVTPHEEQATKWAPYLRERYFDLLIKCTHMETIGFHRTPECEFAAYQKIIDYADIVLAVYDPASARGDAIDQAISYAIEQQRELIRIHPDSLAVVSESTARL